MLGLHVKRGVETTLERVFKSSNNKFGKLEVHWNGTTAGINFTKQGNQIDAVIALPNLDENSNVDNGTFSNLIGYSIHELGHAWFTDNGPWDRARAKYGAFVGNLINGLEDPRIEKQVIASGYAPNSRVLFENLTNAILNKHGYVEPDDKKNIPFMLAIEGRRLNGYAIGFESIVDASPYSKHLKWALNRANTAKDTASIVRIAIELYRRLVEQDKQEKQSEQKQDKQSEQKQDSPSEVDSIEDEGEPQPDENEVSEGAPNVPGDEPGDEPEPGAGKSFEGGRDVEPNQFVKDILKSHSSTADSFRSRPSANKPTYSTFNWC